MIKNFKIATIKQKRIFEYYFTDQAIKNAINERCKKMRGISQEILKSSSEGLKNRLWVNLENTYKEISKLREFEINNNIYKKEGLK